MSKNLYVGSLSYEIRDDELRAIFSAIGTVESAKVIMEPHSDRSKGFGFVEMATEEEAKRAITELNGSSHKGRGITVSEARPKTEGGRGGSRGGFGGGQSRGGFGGGQSRGGFGGNGNRGNNSRGGRDGGGWR